MFLVEMYVISESLFLVRFFLWAKSIPNYVLLAFYVNSLNCRFGIKWPVIFLLGKSYFSVHEHLCRSKMSSLLLVSRLFLCTIILMMTELVMVVLLSANSQTNYMLAACKEIQKIWAITSFLSQFIHSFTVHKKITISCLNFIIIIIVIFICIVIFLGIFAQYPC